MSLHRIDPRFVLPHPVRRAVVLGELDEWRAGLASAGVDVCDASSGPADLVVSPGRLAQDAARADARSSIVEGSRGRAFSGNGHRVSRVVLRPTRERPTLALSLDHPAASAYALERWSVVDRPWKNLRMRAARALVQRGHFPSWGSPVVTVATRGAGAPALIEGAHELGVPRDAGWFLTFGQGDALSRNAFQLFRAGADQPDWVLKFARVPGYSKRFDDDERGLRLAIGAGTEIGAHVPRTVGRLEVDGLHASLETAAAGRRLRDVLLTPGDREGKLRLVERIADWILELGSLTRTSPEATEAELDRLRTDVAPYWRDLGIEPTLVDDLPPLAAVVQHNDLGTWNVVTDDREFAVVDWENARPRALPLWDLLYFLADALVLLDLSGADDADPIRVPERMARLFAGEAPASRRLFALVRRGVETSTIPYDAVGPLATLCWLSHSRSAGDHNVDIDTLTPTEPPRLHGLEGMARAWMSHPALGPGWSAWRG